MISVNHKAIFIHNPKVAGTSINILLKDQQFTHKSLHQAKDGSNDNHTGEWKIGTARRLERGFEQEEWSSYFKFGFVRNPWDRMISSWKNRGEKKYSDFKDFVLSYPFKEEYRDIIWHTMPQYIHLCDEDDCLMLDYTGRFEHLEEDLNCISDILNINLGKVPHSNKTERKSYKEYYDQETIDKVAEIYKKDIELFQYEF